MQYVYSTFLTDKKMKIFFYRLAKKYLKLSHRRKYYNFNHFIIYFFSFLNNFNNNYQIFYFQLKIGFFLYNEGEGG